MSSNFSTASESDSRSPDVECASPCLGVAVRTGPPSELRAITALKRMVMLELRRWEEVIEMHHSITSASTSPVTLIMEIPDWHATFQVTLCFECGGSGTWFLKLCAPRLGSTVDQTDDLRLCALAQRGLQIGWVSLNEEGDIQYECCCRLDAFQLPVSLIHTVIREALHAAWLVHNNEAKSDSPSVHPRDLGIPAPKCRFLRSISD